MKNTVGNLIDEMQRSLNIDDNYIDDSYELMSCREVSEYLNLHINTVYRLIQNQSLKAYNLSVGRDKTYYRIRKVDIENYLEERYCV